YILAGFCESGIGGAGSSRLYCAIVITTRARWMLYCAIVITTRARWMLYCAIVTTTRARWMLYCAIVTTTRARHISIIQILSYNLYISINDHYLHMHLQNFDI